MEGEHRMYAQAEMSSIWCVSCRKELEEVVELLVEREGWENVCVVCCSFSFK